MNTEKKNLCALFFFIYNLLEKKRENFLVNLLVSSYQDLRYVQKKPIKVGKVISLAIYILK